ncbi:MAG: ferredoxin, partial [Oscillospiraceae bacterium]
MKENTMKNINPLSFAADLTPGGAIYASGNSAEFKTGDWRTQTPSIDKGKCTNCLICCLVCPDVCIPAVNGKRGDIDLFHCKGCGIC